MHVRYKTQYLVLELWVDDLQVSNTRQMEEVANCVAELVQIVVDSLSSTTDTISDLNSTIVNK